MGRREIFHAFLLLVEIEGHLTHVFVPYVYETQDRPGSKMIQIRKSARQFAVRSFQTRIQIWIRVVAKCWNPIFTSMDGLLDGP
jgi:hypothetical protein